MAQRRNTELLEIQIVQIGQNAKVYVVFGKSLRVLGQAEFFQPLLNLMHLYSDPNAPATRRRESIIPDRKLQSPTFPNQDEPKSLRSGER